MRTLTQVRLALILTLALGLVAPARGQVDPDTPVTDPEVAEGPGFPWLCFATAVGALGGLYVLVRRREQAVEADPEAAATWYCRACDLDVSGPACPHCRAANPFLDGPGTADPDARPGRDRFKGVMRKD